MKATANERKAKHWTARVAAFERSGLGRSAWCEREGVNANTLDYWRRRLRGSRVEARALVPIQAAPMSTLQVEVTLPGATLLRVSGVTAADVIALVRGLSC